jgi:CheY-like chemotaxis protein
LQSQEGLGSVFTLYFPVSREELPKENVPMVIEDYMGKGESILVVDDIEEQRNIARMLLKRFGYSVTAVPSGEEAVEFMTKHDVDLLVLDMIMDPGIDGLETYKRILKLYPNQKAIIVSGFSETKRVKEAQNLGAGPYVRKPYLMEKIGKAVREELDS